MTSKKTKPPAAADAERLRNTITATAIGSEHKSTTPYLQDRRAACVGSTRYVRFR
jgi:hypothetical protein